MAAAQAFPPMMLIYFRASLPPSMTTRHSFRLRLLVLWLFKCFLPACVRLSRPVAVTRKRFFEALCVFCFGTMAPGVASFGRALARSDRE
jgi:hypothetical protein